MNMKKAPNTNKLKYVGAALLEGESVTLIQAARLVLEIKEALGDEICTITRCREVVSLGLNAIKNKHQTVSFGTAAVECLRSKSHRRPRTLTDIRSIIHKLKKSNPELEHTSLRNLSVEECQNILMNTFTTSRQRHKARLILSGIFSFSVKRGWCDENPILRVDTPFLQEQEIPALTLKEITQLLKAAMEEFDGSCAAGAALMIFAGIRPQEVERLCNAPRHLIELRQVSYITCQIDCSVQGVCIDSASPLQAASRSPQSTASSSSLATPSRSILSLASASRCITLARSLAGWLDMRGLPVITTANLAA